MKGIILAVVSLLVMAPMSANADLILDGRKLLGVSNVAVGGMTYDVSFVDGTCKHIFDGCDSASDDFAFQSRRMATRASRALLRQIYGRWDRKPQLTHGCRNRIVCGIYTPFRVLEGPRHTRVKSAVAWNTKWRWDPVTRAVAHDHRNFGKNGWRVWAKWTKVPEPGTLGLLGLGLLGIGLSRRKHSN